MGEMRNAYSILVGKLEVKGSVGRPRCSWEDIIKMDLREIGCEGVDWIRLALDRDQEWPLVNTLMVLRFPYNAGVS
jgi:hypothetical protein